jgi:hypothetical protein
VSVASESSVRDDRDNGSIVDFVQRRSNQNIGDVRQELRRWLGTPRPELPSDSPARRDVTPIPRDREAVLRVLAAAENVETSLYLNRRGLRPETLHEPRFAGSWKEDARGNVLFIHRDPAGVSGFESKNHGFTGFSAGGTKAVWHSQPQPTDNRLVIAESAIDALSYHQLHKDQRHRTRYMSMGGAPSPYQLELIDQALAKMPKGSSIVAAVDGDEAGTTLAKQLEAIAAKHPHVSFQRHSPELALGKDWNDVVQRVERDYIRSLPGLSRQPTKGAERTR